MSTNNVQISPRALTRLYAPDGKAVPTLVSGKEMREFMEESKRLGDALGIKAEDAELLLRYNVGAGKIPEDRGVRSALIEGLKRLENQQPAAWQVVSGLYDGYENAPGRRDRLRALWKATVLLIRQELKLHEQEVAEGKNVGERSVFWDPVAEVCQRQGISQSKLSAFCRELTGSNLVQTIDNVKAESLRGKLRKEVREFVRAHKADLKGRIEKLGKAETWSKKDEREVDALGAINVTENGEVEGLDKWRVWKALKASRKYPEFCWDTWARELGFASYRRLYRACVCVYERTPHQMILELIEEALKGATVEGAEARTEFKEWSLEEIEGELRAVKPYSMLT